MKTRHKTPGKTCLLLALFLSTSGIFAQPASWKTHLAGFYSSAVLFPYSGSYNTPVFSLSGDKLHSIGKLSGNAFASWGSSHSLYLQKYPTTITCTGIDTKTVTPIETDTPSLIHDPLFITTYSITISQLPTSTDTWNIFTDCSKFF